MSKKQNSVIKVEPPKLEVQQLAVLDDESARFEDEAEFSKVRAASCSFAGASGRFITIEKCQWQTVRLSASDFSKMRLADCRFNTCDLSNAIWAKATVNRTEFITSKLTGFVSLHSYFANVIFDQCLIKSARFVESEFKKVIFSDCKFSDADFQYCNLQEAKFQNCDLTGANFENAKLAGTDFRGCELKGMKVRPQDLKGAIISREQASELGFYFATILGLEVLEF